MSLTLLTRPSKVSADSKPLVTVILLAKDGKQADLVSELTKGFTSDDFPKGIAAVAKAKGAGEVQIDLSAAGDEKKPAEHMEEALGVKGTEIQVQLSLGSTLDEIADQKEKTIAE